MNWSPGFGVDASIGLDVGYKEPVDLSVSRGSGGVYLVVGASVANIRLEPVHVYMLRDQLPVVLADLARVDAEELACQKATEAGSRAEELASDLWGQADAADATGEHERAGELRGAADKLRAAADAVDAAVRAMENAAIDTDRAAEDARTILYGRTPPDDQRAGVA